MITKQMPNKKDVATKKLIVDIKEAREDIKQGNVHDFETICRELGL